MALRKTDDIDIEWLRAYLQRKYPSDVLDKFDQDCADYEAGDIIYDPLEICFGRFSAHAEPNCAVRLRLTESMSN